MKKIILIGLLSILASCATMESQNLASGPVEVQIDNKKLEDVKSKLIYRLSTSTPSWSIKSQASNSLTVTRPCGTSFSCTMMQALIGNSYSTMLQMDLNFVFIEDGSNVKVVVTSYDAWTQMPGGQINTQSVFAGNKKALQDSLNDFATNYH